MQLGHGEPFEHSGPGRIELGRRSGRPPPGDPVGLLHQRDREPFLLGNSCDCHEIRRADASAGAVAEHKSRPCPGCEVEMDAGRTMRRVDLEQARLS